MNLRETGITFGGLHSLTDLHLQYVEKDGHPIFPAIKRNSYEIAGASGSVLLPGETWQTMNFDGTLYPIHEPASQAEAQTLIRQVAAWLTAGRKPLIFDYEPELYYLAEVSAASRWSLKSWFGGEISVRFEAQPYAYAVTPSTATATVTDESGTIALTVATGEPAPLCVKLENTGTATITAFSIGSGAAFSGLELEADDVLEISMEPPAGATMTLGDDLPASALPKATRFQPLLYGAGDWSIQYGLSYGVTGTPGAKITLSARGRW